VSDAAPARATFVLRRAVAADAAALAELGATTFVETFGADNRAEDVEAHLAGHFSAALQGREIADPRGNVLVAEDDGALVGYARTLDGDAPTGVDGARPRELARLYVRRRCIGAGLGATLMRRVLDDAHADGRDVLWLGVWEHNARARRFYEKWGFREVGEVPYQLGADLQRDLVLAVALPAGAPNR
jgi:diamine N-acetyltransferase